MGANSRTYKFALGSALLDFATSGRDCVPLPELAATYAARLLARPDEFPQAPHGSSLGNNDFLTRLEAEREPSRAIGHPTDALVDAAVESIPAMVMRKFHNLRTGGRIAHTFYEVEGRGASRAVRLTPDLHSVAAAHSVLFAELDSRWSIVEASFHARLGRQLVAQGVELDPGMSTLVAPVRRVPLASVRGAIGGFQHGRCFYCGQPFADLGADVHVDHVFPFAWMNTGSWRGPNLNHIWNLVLACAPCNLSKSARMPTAAEVERLLDRNDAIAESPRPLHRALEISMGTSGNNARQQRRHFVYEVYKLVTDG